MHGSWTARVLKWPIWAPCARVERPTYGALGARGGLPVSLVRFHTPLSIVMSPQLHPWQGGGRGGAVARPRDGRDGGAGLQAAEPCAEAHGGGWWVAGTGVKEFVLHVMRRCR